MTMDYNHGNRKHRLHGTPEYTAWVSMRQRCNNPSKKDAYYYDGITICREWNNVEQFVADMGEKPSKNHQLDRIDNTKGYSKENCRWVDRTTQMRNTRLSKVWFLDGVRYESLSHAASVLGTTSSRIKVWCEGRTDGGYTYLPKPGCWSEKRYD
jgi:hypothetical protein